MLYSKNGGTTLTHCLFTTRGRERKKRKCFPHIYLEKKKGENKTEKYIYFSFVWIVNGNKNFCQKKKKKQLCHDEVKRNESL